MQKVNETMSSNMTNYLTNYKAWAPVTYNVAAYGIVGDGIKDNTAAIQSLIYLAISEHRKAIFFQPGIYIINELKQADKVVFFGDNATVVGSFKGKIYQIGVWANNQDIKEVEEQVALKADKNQVNQLATEKADQVYVDTKLAETAKQTEITRLEIELNQKAPVTELDSKRDKTVKITSLDMSDEVKAMFSPAGTVSPVLADKSVDSEKTTFLNPKKNLFNKAKRTAGYYVSSETGELVVSTNPMFDASDWMLVESGASYVMNYGAQWAEYDASKNFIVGHPSSVLTATLNVNTKYVRVSVRQSNISVFQFEKGSVPTEYEDFTLVLTGSTSEPVSLNENSVNVNNTSFLSNDNITYKKIIGLAIVGNALTSTGVPSAVTYKVTIKPNQTIKIKAKSNDRFRVGVLNSVNPYTYVPGIEIPDVPLDKVVISDDGLTEYIFTNDKLGKEMYVYIKTSSSEIEADLARATFDSYDIKTSGGRKLIASGLDHQIDHTEIKEKGINPSNLSFFEGESRSYEVLNGDVFNNGDGTYSVRIRPNSPGFMLYKVSIKPYEIIKVSTDGTGNRLRIAVMYSEMGNALTAKVDRIVNTDDSLKSFEFYNDSRGVELYLYINAQSGVNKYPEATFDILYSKIFSNSTVEYKLEISALTNPLQNITTVKNKYPTLFAVKTSNTRTKALGYNEPPRPIGWLYYQDEEPYKIFYASGTPDNMKELFTWKKEITYGGNKTPKNYSPFITKDGDIIFVFRGEQVDDHTTRPPYNPAARQNPIVYPAGDYNNPVVVDFGSRIKPTNWLMNCGADFIYNQDVFIFSEYTRTVHDKAYVWKVTKPFTNPDNWRIVKEFTLSGDYVAGMKHCHTINFDPYSEQVYLTTGDDSSAAAIYISNDYGETWNLAVEGSEKHCRVLNFVFTEDKIYWATDSFKENMHFLFSINRGSNGKAILSSVSDITEMAQLPNGQATYILALINDPHGLLILDRYDNPSSNPMKVYFWSFETESLHVVNTLYPLNGAVTNIGFRPEATNWYQALNDDRIVCGFGYRPNENALLGNQTNDRVHNLTLKMKEVIKQE